MSEVQKGVRWQLLPGDRVLHFSDINGTYPEGMVKRVDPSASIFAYWVQWDVGWRERMTEGAFQSSCFHWSEMERRGMRPVMNDERCRRLAEYRQAQMKAAQYVPKTGGPPDG